MILLQLSECEDYDIICYDVEGKFSISACSGPTSVEVSYRYKVTSTHWSRLQGMYNMCIITFYYVLVPRILIEDTMHECRAGVSNIRVGETCPGSHTPPVNSYTSKLEAIIMFLFLTMFKK